MIKNYLKKDKKYIVGFSGGPDSLFLINKLSQEIDSKNIIACHVNYNFRKDSSIDQKICEDFCKQKSIKLFIKEYDVDYQNFSLNFEAWARKERYKFFQEIYTQTKAEALLIAHNQNDDVETFLMQKNKNNLVSYFGIKKENEIYGMKIIRPLLEIRKSFILEFLNTNKMVYAQDSTNLDTSYTRNKIRASLNEKDFDKILIEKNKLNLDLELTNKKIEQLLKNPIINLNDLKKDQELFQRLIFEKIKQLGLESQFFSRKKQTLKEVVKQLNSNKSYIKILIGDLLIIKDRVEIHILKDLDLVTFDKKACDLTFFEKSMFKNFDFNSLNPNDWVTNDWENYKNDLKIGSKTLSLLYKKYKIGYWGRFFEPIVYDKTSKKILNYRYFNDKIKSMS